MNRVSGEGLDLAIEAPAENMLALDDALSQLEMQDPLKAQLVRLRFFAGLSEKEVAQILDVSQRDGSAGVAGRAGHPLPKAVRRRGCRRRSPMTETHLSVAHELFLELSDLPVEEQERLLQQRCGHDSSLREEVETLLRSEDAMPATFLGGLGSESSDLCPGARVGAYEIVRFLGEGGMGAVYEARQSFPTRRVALKVIQAARMSSESLRRFQHEAEVLGALQHPGIAHIYEANTARCDLPSGRSMELPYLAMELVRGVSIRQQRRPGRACPRAIAWSWSPGRATRFTTPTSVVSSTGTSSRRTSSSTHPTRRGTGRSDSRRSSTSGSPDSSTRTIAPG